MHPEWAVRAPVVLLTIIACTCSTKEWPGIRPARRRFSGPRAGDHARLVHIGHQTMTDMPFVAR